MKSRKIKTLIILILCLLIIYGIWLFVVPVKNIYANSYDLPQLLKSIKTDINNNDFASANKKIKIAEDKVQVIKNNFVFFKFLKVVPFFNEKYNQIDKSLDDIIIITKNTSEIIEYSENIGSMDKNSIIINFLSNPEKFQKIAQSFDDLSNNVSLLSKAFKIQDYSMTSNIRLIARILEISKPVNKNLLDILGENGDKRYLLLLQNNTELRPTGGFIGTYGILTVSQGKIKNIFIDDIYHLDSSSIGKLKNNVPDPIKKYLKTPEWYMRDCNFKPDFPSAMMDCVDLYNKEVKNLDPKDESNTKIINSNISNIDGVIAINPDVVAELLDIIGAQNVSGILFEGKDFTNDLQKAVELYYKERGVSHWDRKNIISDLALNILSNFKNTSSSNYEKILDLIIKRLETKDIILYSTNPEIEKNLQNANWAGELKKFDGDYFMLVDSNLASFKSDQFINRDINYNLELNDKNELIATAKITYKHNGNFSWNSTKYRDYLRIIVPEGSEFIEQHGSMDENGKEDFSVLDRYYLYGKVSYGSFVVIKPQETKSISFKYKLPDRIKAQISQKSYKILVQKQSGVKDLQFVINANFGQDFSNLKINSDSIINSNLSSINAKKQIDKDTIIQMNW